MLKTHQKGKGPFVLGSEVTCADFVLFAVLESARRTDEKLFRRILDYDHRIEEVFEGCGRWFRRDR